MIYEEQMTKELLVWQRKMMRKPGLLNRLSKSMQDKINAYIPEKVHQAITVTIKQMIRGVLFGAKWTTRNNALIHSKLPRCTKRIITAEGRL